MTTRRSFLAGLLGAAALGVARSLVPSLPAVKRDDTATSAWTVDMGESVYLQHCTTLPDGYYRVVSDGEVVEMLSAKNELLAELPFVECNTGPLDRDEWRSSFQWGDPRDRLSDAEVKRALTKMRANRVRLPAGSPAGRSVAVAARGATPRKATTLRMRGL